MTVQASIEADVEITVAGDFEFGDSLELAEVGGEFTSDDLGRLLELARELKGNGQRDLAEIGLLRLFHCDLDIGAVLCLDEMGNCLLDTSFKDMEHGNASIARGRRYSCLNASMGWISIARRAGSQHANSATAPRTRETAIYAMGSFGSQAAT